VPVTERVRIEGALLRMGTADGDADEAPAHDVRVPTFSIDRTEVTVARYAACVAAGQCTRPGSACRATASGPTLPVACVSWEQARLFCSAAGARLPSEAEWELAARGTDGRTFPWGDEPPDCSRADFAPTGQSSSSCGGEGPSPVGSHPAGASFFGVLDLAGNVWEWVDDFHAPYGGTSPGSSVLAGAARVVRGGTWGSALRELRTTQRRAVDPDTQRPGIGFRCAAASDR
jgi:formylglycine-generating enzyme required for sulfatase activity